MKAFLVARTIEQRLTISAETAEEAEAIARDHAIEDLIVDMKVHATELLAEPEYRIRIVDDPMSWDDYRGYYETEEEAAEVRILFNEYGCIGFIVECRTEVDGEWTPIDSCYGFLGNDVDFVIKEAWRGAPEAEDAEVVYGDTPW